MTSGGRRAVVAGGKGRAANSGWRTVVAGDKQRAANGRRRAANSRHRQQAANGERRAADRGGGPWRRTVEGGRRVAGSEQRAANSRHRQQAANSKQRATDCGGGRRVGGEQQTANSGQEKAGDRRCAADFLQGREGCGDRASEIAEFNVSLYHAAEKRTI